MPQLDPTARSRRHRKVAAAVGLAVTAALTLGACSTASSADADGPVAAGQRVSIVASTNVWGSVAGAVAGDRADVVSIVSDPSADPHSYEASPRDAARITDANLVVLNGGGYDGFLDDILESMPGKRTVDAFELYGSPTDLHGDHDAAAASPAAPEPEAHEAAAHEAEADSHAGHDHDHGHGAVNEHVWYDVPTVDAVAQKIAAELGVIDPANADAYTANAADFHGKLHRITAVTDAIAATHGQAPVAQTEPIAHYLLAAADLRDETPEDFTKAIEDGNDPPPAAIAATRDLLAGKKVHALIYNSQTQDRVTQDVRANAEAAGITVVEVSETLPEGLDYIQWQSATAAALAAALDGSAR
ncbi:metal ABC transporter solute-binding protein, Zn/Mn family [Rhodococcus tukisamuensis]|uniref:Zinc/manganese transport system substrate-binding protein n=1 Tax=Rhodococcus tukisamuensis TaxID=168276 RepID=A0A1G6NF55_9NOCA|nr:zinc ABC transporter substrate-binding protein [Rhodococcus tukisamuensis]SDC66499.1 zinc/manganese transport system substrate-binding protein [Rhodococcus tukisamuensis]